MLFVIAVFLLSFGCPVAAAQSASPVAAPMEGTVSGAPILLRWKDHSSNEVQFVVERRPAQRLTWDTIAYVHWNHTTYTDRDSMTGRYCYRVAAENFSGVSAPSNEACLTVTPPALTPPLLTYSTCCVTAAAPLGVPVLTWPAPPAGIGIHIERRQRSGDEPWIRLTSPPAAEGVLHEHGLNLKLPWCWRAVYVRGGEDSALSNRVCSNE